MSYEFPDDWYEDIDGRSRMLSFEKVGAEIERLRAALVRIADDSWDGARDLKEIARAALGHQQEPPPDDHPLLQMGEDLRPTTLKAKS